MIDNGNYINFSFDKLDRDTDTDIHTPVISIDGSYMYSCELFGITYNSLGYKGLAKFALLPNILSSEDYKYVLELPGGEIYLPVVTLLNTLTASDLSNYMTLYKNKIKNSYT